MDEGEVILEIKNLKVNFHTYRGEVKALNGVDLKLHKKEVLALVGESGCGKSVTALTMIGLLPENAYVVDGEILFRNKNILEKSKEEMRVLRAKEFAIVFQDPMTCLNPLQRISDHLVETIRTHRPEVSKKEARAQAAKLIDRLGIMTERLDDYPHQLSGGMRQRVMIGLALALNADLIIADEPTTSLDVIVEAQFLDMLRELQKQFNLTILLITHNIGVVAEVADRVAVMYAAKLVELADAYPLFDNPLHPYTRGLLKSVPNIRLTEDNLEIMDGAPPDLRNPPPGCRFHPRCPQVMDRCRVEEPPFREVRPGHWAACWLY